MGSITSLKCVLTQEHLDAICAKYFVPEEVHPQLPSSDATMHERPTGKVGMYTRFFDYANYRIPFSTFFVSVLTHFRIPFSQLSVFGSAKVSHFEILCRVCNIEPDVSLFRYFYTHNYKNGWFGFTKRPNVRACYSKNLDSVKNWNDHFFWVDEFVVPANARFPEEFLCWVGISRNYLLNKDTYPRFEYEDGEVMDLNAFIRTADPRKVRIVERPRAENEGPIVTVAKHRTVTLLPTPWKLMSIVPVTEPVEAAVPKPKRKSLSTLNRLLQDSRLTVEQGVPALPTLPFITSFVTASPLELCCSGRSGSGFDAGSIRTEKTVGAGLEEIYVPEWTVTKGFEMNDGRLCANMIDHFTLPAFFKTVRGMEHEQLFTEFNVSAACNLSLSSEAKDKEIEDLKSQLLKAKEESAEVTQLRAQVSGLEATENSLRGEVASAKDHNVLLEQECNSLKLKVTGLESTIAEKDHELSDLGASSSSLKSQNQSLVDQVHELEISSTDLREKLEMYEGSLKQLEEFQDNLMGPLRTRLAEIDADFTRCCMRFQESFHPHLLNVVAGRRWLLTHGMKLLVVKCLNSNEYMEALGHAFGRAIEKGMQEGLAAGIEHGQAGRCLTDLEAYIPSAEDDFNSAIRDLRDLDFPLLKELSDKKDASTWDIMDLLRLDDTVAETLGMTDLQPDVNQLMVPVHHKQDRVVIGSQALSVALDICRGRVEKMERNLIERLPFLKDVFVSIEGATWSWVRVPRKAPLVRQNSVGFSSGQCPLSGRAQMTWILDLV
ncbi:hypothetical protein Tco_0684286 [Tanacetum coccineum]